MKGNMEDKYEDNLQCRKGGERGGSWEGKRQQMIEPEGKKSRKENGLIEDNEEHGEGGARSKPKTE